MTIASNNGVVYGEKYVLTGVSHNNRLSIGDVITLTHDDGTHLVSFKNERGTWDWVDVSRVRPETTPETTPFTSKGWDKYTRLVVISSGNLFSEGVEVKLYSDDGTFAPYFVDSSDLVKPVQLSSLQECSQTPFQAKGWNSETVFRVKRSSDIAVNIKDGEIVKLHLDDNSRNPRFKVISTGTLGYVNLDSLEVYVPTPAEQAGITKGKYFKATEITGHIRAGTLVQLNRDDRSYFPQFKEVVSGKLHYGNVTAFVECFPEEYEIKGYQNGDVFRVNQCIAGFNQGQVVVLEEVERWRFAGHNMYLKNAYDGKPGAFLPWDLVTKMTKDEVKDALKITYDETVDSRIVRYALS